METVTKNDAPINKDAPTVSPKSQVIIPQIPSPVSDTNAIAAATRPPITTSPHTLLAQDVTPNNLSLEAEDYDPDPLSPKNLPNLIVDIATFMDHIQDDGKMSTGDVREMVYSKVKKLSSQLYDKLSKTKLLPRCARPRAIA